MDECLKRSVITYLNKAKNVNLDINHGLFDGRQGSVPFTHSLKAFNLLVPDKEKLSEQTMKLFYQKLSFPHPHKTSNDVFYNNRQPVFRKTFHNARLTVFKGGHEIIHHAALNWLANQQKGKKAVWKIKAVAELEASDSETEANK